MASNPKCQYCDFAVPRLYTNKRGKIRQGMLTLEDHMFHKHLEQYGMLVEQQIVEADSDPYFEEICREENLVF